jgi:hypothetical protein
LYWTSIINLENCVNINDASLKAIAMNCTRLQSLCTDGCDKLSSDVLRCYEFKSVSELRDVLLSITNVPTPELHFQDDSYLLFEEN